MSSQLYAAPADASEDEVKIAKGYRSQWNVIAAGLILWAVSIWGRENLMAVGFFLVVVALMAVEARLYDLCIRVRRTNLWLGDLCQETRKHLED